LADILSLVDPAVAIIVAAQKISAALSVFLNQGSACAYLVSANIHYLKSQFRLTHPSGREGQH
jgi:hypothetical protein